LDSLPFPVDGKLILFAMLAGLAAMTAVGVVAFGNAVRSALCLVLNFFTLALLYFTLNAELIGVTQVIVYTGAIMVLFLFVIMLLNLGAPAALEERPDYIKKALGFIFGGALFGVVSSQVVAPYIQTRQVASPPEFGAPQLLGRALFTTYVWPFEMASILLVIGIVGSILLAKRKI
jgi:NADH-quinone oxidoreductase subunit J